MDVNMKYLDRTPVVQVGDIIQQLDENKVFLVCEMTGVNLDRPLERAIVLINMNGYNSMAQGFCNLNALAKYIQDNNCLVLSKESFEFTTIHKTLK